MVRLVECPEELGNGQIDIPRLSSPVMAGITRRFSALPAQCLSRVLIISVGQAFQLGTRQKDRNQGLQAGGIFRIEAPQERAVEVQDAEEPVVLKQRHDDFRLGRCVARNMPRKRVNVWNDDRFPSCGRCAANPTSKSDSNASHLPLKGSEHEFIPLEEVEANPIQVLQGCVDHCGEVRGIGQAVTLPSEQSQRLIAQLAVKGFLRANRRRAHNTHVRMLPHWKWRRDQRIL